MLLNKEPVLDKGWVALISHANTGTLLQDIQHTYFKTRPNLKLLEIANATILFRCPLFMQLNLAYHNFKIIDAPEDEIEAYIPSVAEIGAGSNSDNTAIRDYFKMTLESLIMNSKSLPMDNCDDFIAQSLMPVSVYNRLIAHGTLLQWVRFLQQKNLPSPIEAYRGKIRDVLATQWKNIDKLIAGT